jgi:hypothetical protein
MWEEGIHREIWFGKTEGKRDLREIGRRGRGFCSCGSMCGKMEEIREKDNENSTAIICGESD